jgi:regulation of enolase protein 1 (concanavalin A-like superfamily)
MSNMDLWSPPFYGPLKGQNQCLEFFMWRDEGEWMEKGITLISDGWLVEAANLPNGYSPWSAVDAKSPMYLGFLGQRHVREQWKIRVYQTKTMFCQILGFWS